MNNNPPNDFRIVFSRDFTFLSSILFCDEIIRKMAQYIGAEYHWCYFTHTKGQVDFYRSAQDEANFNKYLGERCIADELYLKLICEKLNEYTDAFRNFLKQNEKLTKDNLDQFITLHEEHIPWHMAVYWAGEYISSLEQTDTTRSILGLLHNARTYNELLLPEVETWLGSQESISLLTKGELSSYIKEGVQPDEKVMQERNEFAYVYMDKGEIKISAGQAAKDDFQATQAKLNTPVSVEHFKGTLEGMGISKGSYTGTVQKIELPEDFANFKAGSVLVTRMTRPSYNHILKTAGAVITDEGAFLSHAAVLAREFKIPTIIGTKIATKVLNDGDLVEVDADKGMVKKL